MKVIQEHEKCIGCGSCVAICPKYWKISDDGKSKLIGAKATSKGVYELEIKKVECNQQAVNVCPVQCIYVKS